VLGTAGYMSPEQVRGQALDARSDIFSFGAILYEMLSGKRAFHRDTPADTMSAILKEDPADLAETNRNVSPALERIVQHCLEKNPEARFHSASDIAFDLEHMSGISGTSTRVAPIEATPSKSKRWPGIAGVAALGIVLLGLGWWLGRTSVPTSQPEYKQITFRTGRIGNARFTPDGSVVYDAAWDVGGQQLYMARVDDPGSRELGVQDAVLLAISKKGELAVSLRPEYYSGYAWSGTLARAPLSGGSPREVLDHVQDADWAADGENMAVVRYIPENSHWRLEYPIGKVLFDTINWISHPKISPDGKWVAFADHQNPEGDDEGAVAVIAADGKGQEKILSAGWNSLEGVLWSPSGDEIWFTSTNSGSAENPRAVTLSGKTRSLTNVPGGMWLEDLQNGVTLVVKHQQRLGIRAKGQADKEERELGWFGWSELRDISRDGKKVLFEEDADGGGPNYTVFLRDIDGSPPVRIGEGVGRAISPDDKWAITEPARGGPLMLVPTGAGESKPLTHDSVSYETVRWLPDGKELLAWGIEPGHGRRDYLIDVASGQSKPVTPEGVYGVSMTADGSRVVVRQKDGTWGVWSMDGGAIRTIPGLDAKYFVVGWTPDGKSVYASSGRLRDVVSQVNLVNVETGKMEPWKTFGAGVSGATSVGAPHFSVDGTAYAYVYVRTLSEAYVVTGLK